LAILLAARWVDNVMTLLIIGILGGFALSSVVSNAVTALIGSPVIIWFILKRRKRQGSVV